jgi:hypothetical protein
MAKAQKKLIIKALTGASSVFADRKQNGNTHNAGADQKSSTSVNEIKVTSNKSISAISAIMPAQKVVIKILPLALDGSGL